jgi:hypothetical protein
MPARALRAGVIALVVAGALVPAAGAQAPREESLTAWEWYQDVQPPDRGKPYALFVLTPAVFDKARPDLGDLRLYNLADGRKEVPYALRVRRRENVKQEIAARPFNQVTHPDRSVEMSLDLGESRGEYNEIAVGTTPAREFRRRLQVDGSDDGKSWNNVLNRTLAHFEADGQTLDVRRFPFDRPSRFRYLRVRVFPTEGDKDDKPAFTSVSVFHEVHDPGDYRTRPAVLDPRQPVPADGGPGSAWFLRFSEGTELAPCDALALDVDDDEFVRTYRLEIYNPDEPPQFLTGGELRRQAGEAKKPLVIPFPSEVTARRLRLVVTDQRNPPLNLTKVEYTAAARQVIFRTPGAAAPLRLYYGNPKATPPGYDFASTLPTKIDASETSLADDQQRQPNPQYQPPPKPWTERSPWLVYVVLGAASLVLLGLLGLLGREAIARHDAAAPLAASHTRRPEGGG